MHLILAREYSSACWIAQSRISSMNQAFRDQSKLDLSTALPFLAIVVGAILLALAIHYRYNRQQKRSQGNDPGLLFQELCAAYSLTFFQKRALRKLCKIRKLSNPAFVFLDIRLWPTNGEAQRLLGTRTRRKLCELRRNLFQPLSAEKSA